MKANHIMRPDQCPVPVKIETKDFLKIAGHKIQRDTTARAKDVMKKSGHLKHPHPAHNSVSCAILVDPSEDTTLYTSEDCHLMLLDDDIEKMKLDGHTRSYLWDNEIVSAPKEVVCLCFFVTDLDQARDFYRAYDSSKAVESIKDKIYSALHDAFGTKPVSPIWRKTGIKSALSYCFNQNNSLTDERIHALPTKDGFACEALKTIDRYPMLNLKQFNGPVLSAMFITVLRDGDAAMRFWEAYAGAKGSKNEGRACSVTMALSFNKDCVVYGSEKYTGAAPNWIVKGTGRDALAKYVPMYLYYYECWRQKKQHKETYAKAGYVERRMPKMTYESFLGGKTYRQYVALVDRDIFALKG